MERSEWRWRQAEWDIWVRFKVGSVSASLGPTDRGLLLSPECVTPLCLIPNIKWLLCFFWAWKHIHTKGIWFHSWCYCVEGRPHISENSCVEMDGVRTHNLGNISTWKVERLQEGYFSRSQGPLYLPPLRSQTETHMTVLLHAACWSLNIRRRAQLL